MKENITLLERLLDHSKSAKIFWAHTGWVVMGNKISTLCDKLLGDHSNLYHSIKITETAIQNRMIEADGTLSTEWLAVFKKYPSRFILGSDQFYQAPEFSLSLPDRAQKTFFLLDLLSTKIKNKFSYLNVIEIYKIH
ncbi:MAG: hypothetical protein COA79_12310 [Planctomycetota bacterium]|nr:MAG: hypothetical protein COA79_12310 [Planctomycetota bacterium]